MRFCSAREEVPRLGTRDMDRTGHRIEVRKLDDLTQQVIDGADLAADAILSGQFDDRSGFNPKGRFASAE
jgi:hypothetical protein